MIDWREYLGAASIAPLEPSWTRARQVRASAGSHERLCLSRASEMVIIIIIIIIIMMQPPSVAGHVNMGGRAWSSCRACRPDAAMAAAAAAAPLESGQLERAEFT